MIEWPIYRYFSVFSKNYGYIDQNEKGVKKCPFPHSLKFCHNWWASGGVPGVRYAEKLSALFYLHWESLWPGVNNDWRLLAERLGNAGQIGQALAQPVVFVHRDFDAMNLMVHHQQLFMIDFQDAVTGPISYDVISLLRGRYRRLTATA